MIYDVDYFIKKFKAIPEKKYSKYLDFTKDAPTCYMGHCRHNEQEYTSLGNLLSSYLNCDAGSIAFGTGNYKNKSLKKRILTALSDIKKQQPPTYEDITSELASKPIRQEVPDIKIREVITH